MDVILIFRTNVNTNEEVKRITELFRPIEAIRQWSFDLEDDDKVLRVVVADFSPGHIERLLMGAGILCEQMAYEL